MYVCMFHLNIIRDNIKLSRRRHGCNFLHTDNDDLSHNNCTYVMKCLHIKVHLCSYNTSQIFVIKWIERYGLRMVIMALLYILKENDFNGSSIWF